MLQEASTVHRIRLWTLQVKRHPRQYLREPLVDLQEVGRFSTEGAVGLHQVEETFPFNEVLHEETSEVDEVA